MQDPMLIDQCVENTRQKKTVGLATGFYAIHPKEFIKDEYKQLEIVFKEMLNNDVSNSS